MLYQHINISTYINHTAWFISCSRLHYGVVASCVHDEAQRSTANLRARHRKLGWDTENCQAAIAIIAWCAMRLASTDLRPPPSINAILYSKACSADCSLIAPWNFVAFLWPSKNVSAEFFLTGLRALSALNASSSMAMTRAVVLNWQVGLGLSISPDPQASVAIMSFPISANCTRT